MGWPFFFTVAFGIAALTLSVVCRTRFGYLVAYLFWRLRPDNWGKGRYFKRDGASIYFEVHGRGEPLVVLHGGGTLIDCFYCQLPTFARYFTVIAIDSRGHGRSSHGPERLTYNLMAADVRAVLDHLGIASCHLVGWSDGGIIGLLLAIGNPERIGRMVLISANFRPDGIKKKEREATRATKAEKAHPLLRFLYAVFSPHPERWPRLWSDLQGMWETLPGLNAADLASVRAPSLILIGDHDIVSPEHAAEMHAAIAGSELAVVAGASHSLLMEKADKVNPLILHFLRPS